MDERAGDEGLRDQSSSREGGLGELVELLLDNPWLNQALQVAFEARERASQAGAQAMRGLNLPSASDTERLERRVRAVSERLEAVEDSLDRLSVELTAMRQELGARRPPSTSA